MPKRVEVQVYILSYMLHVHLVGKAKENIQNAQNKLIYKNQQSYLLHTTAYSKSSIFCFSTGSTVHVGPWPPFKINFQVSSSLSMFLQPLKPVFFGSFSWLSNIPSSFRGILKPLFHSFFLLTFFPHVILIFLF